MSALLEPPPKAAKTIKVERSTLVLRSKPAKRLVQDRLPIYRFTREELYKLCAEGWFAGQRINLINGRVVVMPPPSPEHDYVLDTLSEILRSLILTDHYVRTVKGFNAGNYDEPLPDLIVVPGSRHTYLHVHPTQAIFAAEVSNTTLAYDSMTKATLYARAGVPEYWVIDLKGRRIIVHTQPRTDDSVHSYGSVVTFAEGRTVAPLFAPAAAIAVETLLPPASADAS